MAVDAVSCRPIAIFQDAHSSVEQLVHQNLWNLGSGDANFRSVTVGYARLCAGTSVSRRNMIRVMASLLEKGSVEVVSEHDSASQTCRTYRVWDTEAAVQRIRQRGFTHVYRNRNAVEIVSLE